MRWECPPSGRLKINIDGSFLASNGCGGVGVIVRDETGLGIATLSRPVEHAHSVLNMEVEACRVGLLLGTHQCWTNIDIKSDFILLVAALGREEEDLSEVGRVLCDCKDYMKAFQSITIQHVSREANGVANRLAHLVRMGVLDDIWLEETLAIIQDVLYEDINHLNIVARGLGSMLKFRLP
ncbi:PREDICTED: uncharacterized protein LOC101294625 [Fragaria vesca subsp. vesca]